MIKVSLGIEIRKFWLFSKFIIPNNITSDLEPSTNPLDADEFSFLSSDPISK
jgi:hypothetical protein